MSSYEFQLDNNSGVLSIVINQPKFDAASAAEFKDLLDAEWSDAVKGVEIDFDQVQFIDSSGVGALLGVQKKIPKGSPAVTLVNARPNVVSVIELLRLHRVFNLKSI